MMLQLYFLSIVCNALAGFMLAYGDAPGGEPRDGAPGDRKMPFLSGGFRLIVGIVTAVTGFLKLLAPVRVPILGDLLPAAAGMAAGFLLVYTFYREQASGSDVDGVVGRAGGSLLRYRKPVGIACMAAAALHFLFPYALFL